MREEGEMMTTTYEMISRRRQVREYRSDVLDEDVLASVLKCVNTADHLNGQKSQYEILPSDEVKGGVDAPYYIMSYCDETPEAFADVGYVMQKADLHIQGMGLGSGWFMGPKPARNRDGFCIALAFGMTDVPERSGPEDFKRRAVSDVSATDNEVSEAVRLAPSSLNSQPWKVLFRNETVTVEDVGHGAKRLILGKKLNRIDVGIAARHAQVALEHMGRTVMDVTASIKDGRFGITLTYKEVDL